MNLSIDEVSEQVAALALQGPNALKILDKLSDAEVDRLQFFRMTATKIRDIPVIVSRTDTRRFGYEIWFRRGARLSVWDIS